MLRAIQDTEYPGLLAVDMGLRCGMALYDSQGYLRSYASRHFGSRRQLKAGASHVVQAAGNIERIVIEGGGDMATPWISYCERRGIGVTSISAEQWRKDLIVPSLRIKGTTAKEQAVHLALKTIQWSSLKTPTSLRHDAAEAILAGLWSMVVSGTLPGWPEAVVS